MQSIADELTRVVNEAAAELRTLGAVAAAAKPRSDSWSIKEIVGHLIDSAANNHQRFVRAQGTGQLSFPGYVQDAWVRSQDHQSRPWLGLVEFWVSYNHHLAHTIRRIPESALNVPCRIGANEPVTLRFLVEDYLVHVRHHLKQIEDRRAV
ncbi:MAG TPA: DinB family protein [Vicinamibacterales bacterium]